MARKKNTRTRSGKIVRRVLKPRSSARHTTKGSHWLNQCPCSDCRLSRGQMYGGL